MGKDIQKSVRMTDEVYNYVMGFRGEGFNQKFENLVDFCMEEEADITANIDRLQREKQALADEIALYRSLRLELKRIDERVKSITSWMVDKSVLPGQQAI